MSPTRSGQTCSCRYFHSPVLAQSRSHSVPTERWQLLVERHLVVLALVSGQVGVDDAGGDEAAGALSTSGGDLDDVGEQRVDGATPSGGGGSLPVTRINLHQVKRYFPCTLVVVAHAAVVDLDRSRAYGRRRGPRSSHRWGPDRPTAGGVGAAVQIGVLWPLTFSTC